VRKLDSRIEKLHQQVGPAACRTCAEWLPPGSKGLIIVKGEAAEAVPDYCPACGRRLVVQRLRGLSFDDLLPGDHQERNPHAVEVAMWAG
jgi:hypothetical protein